MEKLRREGEWLLAKVGDELVMMNSHSGIYIALSEVGTRIWEIVETPSTIAEICGRLQQEYSVPPEVCEREVRAFVAELKTHGALADIEQEP